MRHGFRILGPVELWTGDRQVDLGSGKQRAVLAMLLLASGRPCSVETLIDRLWDEDPPSQARNTMYSYISRLRRVLREAQLDSVTLQQRNGGYLLEAPPGLVDLHRFDAAVQQARETQDLAAQADLLREALDCWHGTPLADVPGRWADETRRALGKRRVGACVGWATAMIELGRCAEAADLLERELAEYPDAEPLAGRLMDALHRQGRHAEALACYAALRRRLVDNLGAEPSPALQQLHLEILRAEEPASDSSENEMAVVLSQLADAGLIVINDNGVAIVHERVNLTRKPRKTIRPALVGVGFVLVVVMLFVGFTVVQIDQANARRDQAMSARLAADARGQLLREPELALLLAKRAVEIEPSESAQAVLAQALTESRIRATWRGHQGAVTGLDVSRDGRRVVTSGADRTIRVWRVDGERAPVVLTGHTGAVRDVVFSPDGNRIASASADGSVRIWRADQPGSLRFLDSAGTFVALAWSPDGRRLAGAGADGTIRVWTVDGDAPVMILDGRRQGTNAVAWSPDSRQLASAGNDGKLVVRDLVSEVVTSRASAGGAITDVTWSRDGRHILTGSADAKARIWPAAGDGPPADLADHQDAVETVAYSHNGRFLVTGGRDRTAYIAPADGRGDRIVLRGANGPIRAVAFSHDDRLVVTGSEDGTVRLWDPSPKPGLRVWPAHARETTDTEVSPDGAHIASVGDDGTTRVDGRLLDADRREPLKAVAFSPDSQIVVAAGEGRTVLVWPTAGGVVRRLQTGHGGTILGVAISADGKNVATAGDDGSVLVSSVADGSNLAVLSAYAGAVHDVAYSADGRLLASAHADGTVRVWKLADLSQLVLRGTDGMRTIAFSPDSQFIAGVGNDGTIRVWQASGAGSPVLLQGHYGRVDGIAFSDDGQYIASTGSDHKVRLWKWAVRTDPVVFDPHTAATVTSIDFGRGQQLAVGRGDGAVDTWNCEVCVPVRDLLTLASQRITRDLTGEERALYLSEPR